MKKICFLIGNGSSRDKFDLEQLRGKGTIVGCNAIYRDFTPDVLIAIDAKMLREIGEAKYENYYVYPKSRNPGFPCSHKIETKGANTSGAAAMMYASYVNADLAFLIGYDCYQGNMYDGTHNYTRRHKRFEGFIRGYRNTLKAHSNLKVINVIKDRKDGITHELKDLPNYLGTVDMEVFCKALSKLPYQEPLLSINIKKS